MSGAGSCGAFPAGIEVSELTFPSAIKAALQSTIILSDRGNILKSTALSIVFRKKLVLRILGLGDRLKSRKLFSLRTVYSAVTYLLPPDLIISTIDGSYDQNLFPINSRASRHRINGVSDLGLLPFTPKSLPLGGLKFFFIGRSAEEKGMLEAVRYFNKLEDPLSEFHLFGPSEPPAGTELFSASSAKLFYYGFLDRAAIEAVLPDMSIMISANKVGCLGNAELEAISFGKPVIYLGNKEHLNFIPRALRRFYLAPGQYQRDRKAKWFCPRRVGINNFDKVHDADVNSILRLISDQENE